LNINNNSVKTMSRLLLHTNFIRAHIFVQIHYLFTM